MSASASPNLVHLPSYSPSEGAWAVGAECKGRTLLRAQIVQDQGERDRRGSFLAFSNTQARAVGTGSDEDTGPGPL